MRGLTLIELMVAIFIGGLITALVIPNIKMQRKLLQRDTVRTQIDNDIYDGLELIGTKIQQAGTNLGLLTPAIEITNGTPDEIKIRVGLEDHAFRACRAVSSSDANVTVVRSGHTGCENSDQVTEWTNYRTAAGGSTSAFIYDTDTGNNEFFTYDGETFSSGEWTIDRDSGTWSRSYPRQTTRIYILEEWHVYADSDYLKLRINNGTEQKINYGVTDLQITATLFDDTTVTSFSAGNDWSTLKSIDITLSLEFPDSAGGTLTRTVARRFYIRNQLAGYAS